MGDAVILLVVKKEKKVVVYWHFIATNETEATSMFFAQNIDSTWQRSKQGDSGLPVKDFARKIHIRTCVA